MLFNRFSYPLLILASALILATPALWNGFPFLYWDSLDYIVMPFSHDIPPFRTASYSLMMLPGVLTGTLWTPMALQCLLTAFVLYEGLDAFSPAPVRRALLPTTVLLSVFTCLPWISGQLMADAFTGLVVLALAVLAFAPPPSWGRRIGLAGVVALGVAVHTSHLAMTAGLLLVLAGLGYVARRRLVSASLRPRLALPAAGLVCGVLLAGVANWAVSGSFHIAQSNALLMFARTLQDGVGHRWLAEVCPQRPLLDGKPLRICDYRDRLPHSANSFLWAPGPFYELGGWNDARMKEEAGFVVRDSLKRYPAQHLRAAAALMWEQLWMFKSGDGLIGLDTIHKGERTTVKSMFMPRAIADHYPSDLHAYWNSEQRYGIKMSELNALHLATGGLAVLGLGVCGLLAWRARDMRHVGLALTVGLCLLGNAFVCGALSNPNDRYQARIVWVAVLTCGLIAARRIGAAVEEQDALGDSLGDAATAEA